MQAVNQLARNRASFAVRLERSFWFRAQAIFYGRLAISSLYAVLFIISLVYDQLYFPNSLPYAILIFISFSYTRLCYRLKANRRIGRWAHFVTLNLDVLIHFIFTSSSHFILSPLMAIHPLFTAMFLLLFHNPFLIAIPLTAIPLGTIMTLWLEPSPSIFALIYTLLLYCSLDALIIFFIHLVQSQEQRLMKSLVAMEQRLKSLALVEERARIARDFHDGIGAQLTSIVMQCDYMIMKMPDDGNELVEIRESAVLSMEDMRRSVALLHDDFDIAEQLQHLCENMRERHQINVKAKSVHILSNLELEQQIGCCRIVQEALTNALKHASATLIEIAVLRDEHRITLSIKDNGCGFDIGAEKRNHFGLGNMHHRAQQMGGTLSISSKHGEGTMIVLAIPKPYE